LLEQAPPDLDPQGQLVPGRLSTNVSRFLAKTLGRVGDLHLNNGRVPTGREVYERTRLYSVDDDEPFAALVRRLDGSCTFARAVEAADVPMVPAYRYVREALKVGRIRRVSLRGARKVAHEDLLDEIDALRDLLPQSQAPAIVRLRLAHAYEVVGRTLRAATQWKHLGRYWEQRGAFDQALEYFRNCVRLVPTDLATREAIVEVHRNRGDERGVISDGRPLADLFFKYNLPRRASVLLMKLVELEEHDIALRRQLTTVLIGLGAKGLALRHLHELATLLEENDAEQGELRDVYLQILALDHRNKRARLNLDSILGATSHRRAAWMTVTVTAVFLVALWGWYGSEVVARRTVGTRVQEAAGYMQTLEFDRARSILQSAIDRHPLSSATNAAQRMLEECDALKDEVERRKQANPPPPVSDRTRKAREAASALAIQAASLMASGQEREGHAIYTTVFERYPWAPELARAELPLTIAVRPRDALIRLDGKVVGRGASTLWYTPAKRSTLSIERDGFEPYVRTLDGPLDREIELALEPEVRWRWTAGTGLGAPPVKAGEQLYVAAHDGVLKALSLSDGSPQWAVYLGLYADAAAQPVVVGDRVVVATSDGQAICVDPASGEIAWRRELGAHAEGQPIRLGERTVAVPATDGSVTAFDAPSGEQRMLLPPGSVTSGDPAALPNGSMIFVDQARALSVVNPETGRISMPPNRPVGLLGTPAVSSTHTWSLAEDRMLCVISNDDGRQLGRVVLPHATRLPPAIDGERAFLVSKQGHLMGFDATGNRLFRPVKLPGPPSAAPEYSRGRIYVPAEDGHLYVLDSGDGSLLWSFDAGERITSRPVFDYGTAYLVTERGSLIALAD